MRLKQAFAIIFCFLAGFPHTAFCQGLSIVEHDSLLAYYLRTQQPGIDENAEAVVLYEQCTARPEIVSYDKGYFQTLTITVERCIKINSQQALGLADIVVPFSKDLKLKDISLQAINLEQGRIHRERTGRADGFKEKISGSTKVYKFSLPNIRPGSVIFYSYTYELTIGKPDHSLYYPLSWNFQGRYPVVESRFELDIPNEITYSAVPRNINFDQAEERKGLERGTQRTWSGATANRQRRIWVVRNSAALEEERYVLNTDDKLKRLNLYLSSYFPNPQKAFTYPIPQEWQKANASFFYNQKWLGRYIFLPDDSLSFYLNRITAGATTNLQLARNIYRYVRDSVSYNGEAEGRIWGSMPPLQVLNNRNGTRADMNILLCALYQRAGLKSYPILLSTTANGTVDPRYFEPDGLNYVVTCLIIGKRFYLLDPSSPNLPFGVLRKDCYNGFSWLVNEQGLAVKLSPDSLQENNIVYCIATPGEQTGAYHVSVTEKTGNVSGPVIRALLQNDPEEARKAVNDQLGPLPAGLLPGSLKILNQQNRDTDLLVSYTYDMNIPATGDLIYLDPFFRKFYETNPFTAIDRKYPVEFGNASTRQYILVFKLPDGYEPEDYAHPVNISFNNDHLSYHSVAQYDYDLKILTLRSTLKIAQSSVAPEYYQEIRSFFASFISAQRKKLAIRKRHQR